MIRKFILAATALAGIDLASPPRQAEASRLSEANGWEVQFVSVGGVNACMLGYSGGEAAVSFQFEATRGGRLAALRISSPFMSVRHAAGTARIDVGGRAIDVRFRRQSRHAVRVNFPNATALWSLIGLMAATPEGVRMEVRLQGEVIVGIHTLGVAEVTEPLGHCMPLLASER